MSQHLTVLLSPEERQYLDSLIRRGTIPARVQTRARILLLADRSQGEQRTQKQIAESILVAVPTVCQVCRRFVQEGMQAALTEKLRPGAVPKITGEIEAHLCLLACSDPPAGHAHWTLRLLRENLIELGLVESITEAALCQRLKKTRSNPGKSKPGASVSPLPAM